jgi:HK97 family phage portal protein
VSPLFPARGVGTALAKYAPKPLTAPIQNPPVQTKALPVMTYPVELFFDIARTTSDATTARAAMAAYALCYSCLRYRATKLIEAPLWIVDETNEGETWLEGEHELSTLLETPNPDMEMQEFLDLVSLYLDTTGACLIVKNADRAGRTGSLYPFAKDEFSVEPGNGRLFGRFQVRTLGGTEWKQPDEVIYLRAADPRNLYQSLSPTDVALSHINLGRSMVTAIKSALRNAVRPGAIVTVEGELSDEAFQRIRQEVKVNWEGVHNTGSTVLFEGGATLTPAMGATLKDMALGPLQEDVESAICAAYGLHPVLVGGKVGIQATSGMSDSIKPLTDKAYDDVIIPRWQYIERAFTRALLRPVDPRPRRFLRFDTSDVRGLQVDMTARVEEAAGAVGFWTINEQRAHTMRPPIAEGDQLAADRLTAEQEAAAQSAAGRASSARRDAGQKAFPSINEFWEDLAAPLESKVATVFIGQRTIAPELVTKAWEAFDTKAASQEAPYERAARAQFDAEADAVARMIETSVPSQKAIDPLALAAAFAAPYLEFAELKIAAAFAVGGLFYQQWVRRYRPIIAKTMAGAGKDLADQIGIDWTISNPEGQRAIQRRVTQLAGAVTETTAQKVRDVIAQAKAEGVGVSEIAKRIRAEAFGDTITKARATTIARTETVGALNEGEMIAAKESGVFRSKKWISQRVGDSRPRHIAEENAGWVALDAPYTVTGKMRPHDGIGGAKEDVNCRCSQLFSDLTADEANGGAQ